MTAESTLADGPLASFRPEIAAFKAALPALLAEHHEGQFVVLKSGNVEQILPTYEKALSWAYKRYGLDGQFFVKQVLESPDHLTHFHRIR